MDSKSKDLAALDQHALLEAVRNSAQQIWQAGLGAFARIEQEGSEMFDKLVQDGSELHRLTQSLPDGGAAIADKFSSFAGNVSKQASGSWDKLEKIFEDRVARAMRRLGVPSQDAIDTLRAEIASLKAAMAELSPPAKSPRKAAARPAEKAAAKPASKTARKSPAKAVKKAAAGVRQSRAGSTTH